MLDFNVAETQSQGEVKRVVPKRKGSDSGGLIWDIDIAFPISSPEAIGAMDSVMHGSALLINQGEADSKSYTVRDSTEWGPGHLVMKVGKSKLVDAKHAEIRFTVLTVVGKLAKAVTRFRVGGMGSERADLIDQLGEEVEVTFSSDQQQFQFDKKKSRGEPAYQVHPKEVHLGEIVELEGGFAGTAQSIGKDDLTVVDLDGAARTAKLLEVRGAFRVTGSTGDGVGPEMARYKQRCTKKSRKASWKDIVKALTDLVAEGRAPRPEGWVIDSDVLDLAVKMAEPIPMDVPRMAYA